MFVIRQLPTAAWSVAPTTRGGKGNPSWYVTETLPEDASVLCIHNPRAVETMLCTKSTTVPVPLMNSGGGVATDSGTAAGFLKQRLRPRLRDCRFCSGGGRGGRGGIERRPMISLRQMQRVSASVALVLES